MPFAARKPKKRRKKMVGSKNDDSVAKKKNASLGNRGAGRCALVLGGFLPPEPPELEKKRGFYLPFQWIRGGPLGDARSRARGKAFFGI